MIQLILLLIGLSLIMEIVDSSLGMFYGTLLSPLLVGLGFEPLLVVSSILVSQGVGGFFGTIFHHKYNNANFRGLTKDVKVVLLMVLPGLIAVVIGALVAVSIPKIWLKTYMGALVIIMSLLCLSKRKYKFSWWKHSLYGSIAAFNKVLSGGGFGPITSTGGIIAGLSPKASIATTTFAELIICTSSFIALVVLHGFPDLYFAGSLCIGAGIGGIIGPYACSKINQTKLRKLVAALGIMLGVWLLVKIVI